MLLGGHAGAGRHAQEPRDVRDHDARVHWPAAQPRGRRWAIGGLPGRGAATWRFCGEGRIRRPARAQGNTGRRGVCLLPAAPAGIVLGKHSGRNALNTRLKSLGYELSSEELDDVFRCPPCCRAQGGRGAHTRSRVLHGEPCVCSSRGAEGACACVRACVRWAQAVQAPGGQEEGHHGRGRAGPAVGRAAPARHRLGAARPPSACRHARGLAPSWLSRSRAGPGQRPQIRGRTGGEASADTWGGAQVVCGTMGMPTATVHMKGPDGISRIGVGVGTGEQATCGQQVQGAAPHAAAPTHRLPPLTTTATSLQAPWTRRTRRWTLWSWWRPSCSTTRSTA